MGQHQCPVCLETHSVEVLLHKRLRKTLPPTMVTGYSPCPKCKGHMDSGMVAMVSVKDSPKGDTLKMEDANYAGAYAFLKDEAFRKLLDQEPPKGRMVFVDEEFIAKLKEIHDKGKEGNSETA